jgi:hypothetical protein
MPHTVLWSELVYGSASGATGAGSPTQVAPRFSVRAIDVHGLLEHGAVPSTNASSVDTNVTEVAANPLGTGPSAGVAAGLVAGAADVGVVAAGVVGEPPGVPDAVDVTDEPAPAPGPELTDPHPVSDSTASSAVMPTATPDARMEILIRPPNAVGPQAVVTAGDQIT